MLYNYNANLPLYIVGTGVYAQEVKDWISHDVVSPAVLISPEDFFLLPDNSQCIIGFVTMEYRKNFLPKAFKFSRQWPIFVHPTSVVSSPELLGAGTVVGPLVSIGYGVTVQGHSYIATHTKLGHGDQLGSNVCVSPGTMIGGSTIIGNNVYFGQASSIRDRITICSNTWFTMNSVVTKNILDPGDYSGNRKITRLN